MAKKSNADMALEDKIDLARTLLRYTTRREYARKANDVEDAIKKTHEAEVASGSVSTIDLESIDPAKFLVKELPSGDSSPDTDSDSD